MSVENVSPVILTDRVSVYNGDCVDMLKQLPAGSVDVVITDPPYGLEFQGHDWDAPWKEGKTTARGDVLHDPSVVGGFQDGKGGNPFSRSRIRYGIGNGFQEWVTEWASECLRVLKPGGHIVAFGGARTWHRLASGIEDAGFEIRDSMAWLNGQGFPKSQNVGKAVERELGARARKAAAAEGVDDSGLDEESLALVQQWTGWGTALKPAFEPIVVGRKPLTGSVAVNVLEYGTGAMNIDAARIEGEPYKINTFDSGAKPFGGGKGEAYTSREASGRWPANVVLDGEAADALDASAPSSKSRAGKPRAGKSGDGWGMTATGAEYNDEGGPSRFYPVFRYEAKAPTKERPKIVNDNGDEIGHPTVKPLALMQWLCRLFTPEGGTVLDPFLGSGTTAQAALAEGFRVIGVERDPMYVKLIRTRLGEPQQDTIF